MHLARPLLITAAGALLLPASSFGAVTIGSNLSAGGTPTNACTSQACTFAQVAPLPAGDTAPGGLTAPSDGVVTRWRIKSGSAGGAVMLRILRPTGGGSFTGAGTSASETTAAGTAQFNTRLPIKAGDYLGVDNASDALIFASTPGASIYRWIPPLADGSNRAATDTRGTLELMVQADVEPDVDCDGLGDETQDPNTADGPCAPHGGTPDTTAPRISSLKKSPRKPRARKRMTISYKVSEDATVKATIQRCTKVKKKRCTRWRRAGTARQNAKATSSNRFRFKPRQRGLYRATLVATDAAKNASGPKRIKFRVR